MAGLQRSSLSFRRQGSSGLVWDDKFLSQLNKLHQESLQKDATNHEFIKTAKSDGGQSPVTVKVAADQTVEDPPESPRAYSCCFGCVFRGSRNVNKAGKSK